MLPPTHLTPQQKRWWKQALSSSKRHINVKVRVYDHSGNPVGTKLIFLDGEIVGDKDNDGAPVTADLTFVDATGKLRVRLKDRRRHIWFSKQIGIFYGVWVAEMDQWVYTPEFRGPIIDPIEQTGAEIHVTCASKEIQHVEPHVLDREFNAKENQRIWWSIKRFFAQRGETKFDFARPPRRLKKSRVFRMGAVPMRVARALIGAFDPEDKKKERKKKKGKDKKKGDKNEVVHSHVDVTFGMSGPDHRRWMLFFRGNGALLFRPVKDKPIWQLTEGEDSIITAAVSDSLSKEGSYDTVIAIGKRKDKHRAKTRTKLDSKAEITDTTITVASNTNFGNGRTVLIGHAPKEGQEDKRTPRSITNIAGSTITLKRALTRKYEKGTPVVVFHTTTKPRPIEARAHLPWGHPLSRHSISGGKRPVPKILRRPHIDKRKQLKNAAEKELKHGGRLRRELAIRCTYIPGSELNDVLGLKAGGVHQETTIERFAKSLAPDGDMETNWSGNRVPRREKRKRKQKPPGQARARPPSRARR